MSVEQSYIDIYKQYGEVLKKNSAAPMNELREKAFESFERLGFPTQRLEAYQYTDLKDLFGVNYGMNLNRVALKEDFRCDVPGINAHLFYIVNDTFYCPAESEKALLELRARAFPSEVSENMPKAIHHWFPNITARPQDAVQMH